MKVRWLLPLGLAATPVAHVAFAAQYMTVEQAQRAAFPDAGEFMPRALDAASLRAVRTGRPLPAGSFAESMVVRLLTPAGYLAAVAEVRERLLRTLRVFNYGLTAEKQ